MFPAADMSAWEAVANMKIREGAKAGAFKKLSGEGQPIKELGWAQRHQGNANALGDKILRNSNAAPSWLQV